ncbi:hypothetical protein LCGC14_2316550 [marine sediment metagenome]|uniref:PD-(D/E)XK endonuclease-like domain-containing protein n=1 Tax=marine sediment metagenome TaxID=412755 RepID=A0A0F9FDZ9_9ZZZZ
MRRELNPQLDRFVLDALAEKYHLTEKRTGIHLSTLNYCLTKSYLDLTAPLPPTDTELVLFSTGYGLEAMMTHSTAETPLIEVEGITYRPDNIITMKDARNPDLIEFKSTRAGVKRYQEGDLPATWLTYMKGGCYMMEKTEYNLSVIYLAERPVARIISETIYFDEEEIADNWSWLLERKAQYEQALETETCPTPHTTAPDWMCGNCKYSLICEAIIMMEARQQ